jgi:Carboxypeptidase regulatory-like domain
MLCLVRCRNVLAVHLIVLAMAYGPFSTQAARAQDSARYSFAWRGDSLDEALRQLQAATDINIVWLPVLAEAKRVYCVIRDQPAEAVLKCMLSGTGLDFYRRSSGTYVIEPALEAPPLWGNMRGIILDAATGRPVSAAHVYLADARRGRVANESGMFAFDRLLPGQYAIEVSHIGYRTSRSDIVIEPGGSARPEISLEAQTIMLAPLVFEGLATQSSSSLLGSAMIDQEALASRIGVGGPLGGVDALMGVRVNDATADIHIQGGDAGEHQFRLDGAPVFIPLNLISFIGPFSPFALGEIRISKAGFGASLGSQISGVIEARHDLGYAGPRRALDSDSYFGRALVQADPLSVNGRYTGYLTRANGLRASFMGATRVGIWGLATPGSLTGLMDDWNRIDSFLLSAFADRNTPFNNFPPVGSPGIGFADVHLAAEVRKGLRTFSASAFIGGSRLGNDIGGAAVGDLLANPDNIAEFRDVYYWRNATAQASYETVLTARTLGSLQVRYSRYRLRHDFTARDEITRASPEDDGNSIYEAALSGKLDYTLADHHYTEIGTELIVTGDRFRVAGSQQLPLKHEFTGWRAAGYVQDKIQIGSHAVVEAGSRFTYLQARRSLYAEPRLSLRMDYPGTRTGSWSVFLGTGIYRQFVNQFDISSRSPRTFVSSSRFWMAVDSTVAPAKSGHVALEVFWRPTPRWSLNTEVHYKRHYQILSLDYSANTDLPNLVQRDFLRSSRGRTKGFAAILKRSFPLGGIQARYEYTDGRRQISGLFENRLLDVPWNEPHRVELSADLMPIPNLVVLARWRVISGRTWGFRRAYYDFMGAYLNDVDQVLLSVINVDARKRIARQAERYALTNPESHRLPPLAQLDIGLGYSFGLGPIRLQARLDAINILGRVNTADWRFLYDEDRYFGESGDGFLDRGSRELLPRVTTFALRVSW